MSSVVMPRDRTNKQPARGFCRNPQCREEAQADFTFEIRHAHVACPKCGANRSPMVGVFVITHLLLPVKGGPLRGSDGRSYALVCDDKRAYTATHSNLEAASGDIEVVNCPQCVDNAKKLGIVQNQLWTPGGDKQ